MDNFRRQTEREREIESLPCPEQYGYVVCLWGIQGSSKPMVYLWAVNRLSCGIHSPYLPTSTANEQSGGFQQRFINKGAGMFLNIPSVTKSPQMEASKYVPSVSLAKAIQNGARKGCVAVLNTWLACLCYMPWGVGKDWRNSVIFFTAEPMSYLTYQPTVVQSWLIIPTMASPGGYALILHHSYNLPN